MVYGRRRVGKTFLLQRYFTGGVSGMENPKPCCYFLADQSTPENQRFALAERLIEALPSPGYTPEEIAISWNALFRYVSTIALRRGDRIALVLDEFPYLVAQTPGLPSVLQAWWDQEGVHAPVSVVLCGSQLSTMASLGKESAPLFGRFNAGILKIEPMRYDDVARFYAANPGFGAEEKLVMYGVLGGMPRYHALVGQSEHLSDAIVNLLMRPGSPLENEVRFLLSSEQIRDPAPYNSILRAVARGRTKYGEIQQATGIEGPAMGRPLKVLQDLGWVVREIPYGETSDRRAIYRIADPYLSCWYRFVAPLASALQFDDPERVFHDKVAPFLSDYMGWSVFEGICAQWLRWHGVDRLGWTIRNMGRFWDRKGGTEIDIVAELDDGRMLFGECKWSAHSKVGVSVYADLMAKARGLPNRHWAEGASFVLFSFGGFSEDLIALGGAVDSLRLVDGRQLLPDSEPNALAR